jgi:UDP-N-acetylglucosamine acyltransferase
MVWFRWRGEAVAGVLTQVNMMIHPSAIVDPSAELDPGVSIGPFCVVGPHVHIGRGTTVEPHVTIQPWTTIGRECHISPQAVLGGPPQDSKFKGERSYLLIGDRTIIREAVTIHRATGENEVTRVGSDCMIMAYCHIGHNCVIGNGVMMANQVGIAGHVVVEDQVVFGGMVGIHQYVSIGKLAMLGGFSKVVQDVPPFMMVDGRPAEVVQLNVRGLRRAGMTPHVRSGLKQAYRLLSRSNLNLSQAIEAVEGEVEPSEERDYLLAFLSNIRRGYSGRQNDPNKPQPEE